MNVKSVFDCISWAQLALKIANFNIDDNLIGLTKSFLTNKWVKLVINDYIDAKHNVEMEIAQQLSISFIFFLIYISKVFSHIESDF